MRPARDGLRATGEQVSAGSGPSIEWMPNGTGWLGRFRLTQNRDNDFLVDRELQKSGSSYTGIPAARARRTWPSPTAWARSTPAAASTWARPTS